MDPSPIIGYPCHSLTHSLTHCHLRNLIDVTLACEDAYSKLVEVVTVADNTVSKLNLGQDYEARFGQGFKFKFSRDADVWVRF